MSNDAKEINTVKSSETGNVSDTGFKRKVVAFTVGAVILLFVLIVLMCYQMITIGVQNRKKADLIAKIAELEEEHKQGEGELAFRRTDLYVERIARELGYHYPDDAD